MAALRNIEKYDGLKDDVGFNKIFITPMSFHNCEMHSYLNSNFNSFLNSNIFSETIYPIYRASESLSIYFHLYKPSKTKFITPTYYIKGCNALNSSKVLYDRSVAIIENNLLQYPNIVNVLNKNISHLELQISSELRFLSEQETKWTTLINFAEEYKKTFEITDEELWFEYGNELDKYTYERDTICITKRIFHVTKYYINLVRKNLSFIINLHKVYRICNLKHQIAFSTKNLDDEHYPRVKTYDHQVFTILRILFNEEININKTSTVCLQERPTKRAKKCYPGSYQAN